VIFNNDDVLVCPCCGDPDSYLHHDRVSVFCRQEDAETVTKTVVADNGMAAISRVQNSNSGNPSRRRDGIAIRFELAGLRAARLVTAVETEEGRRWAESKIKMLTGGDKIAARFMRQDFFEFTPQFKLVIAGNHKPGLRSVDEAIRRRFNLLPFTVTIPTQERDEKLTEKLRAEWPGILEWMIDGCIEWQDHKLAAPKAVTDATAAYLEAEDAVAAWIEDCADRDPNAWENSNDLFGSWTTWANKNGEHVGSQKRFAQALETRGLTFHRRKDGRGFYGLSLRHVYAAYP
jgi:putative DNA primase/helicase